MNHARALRTWAGSLSPAWQAVVPGLFAWSVSIAPSARASRTSLAFAIAALAVLVLGALLERRLPVDRGRLLGFWGFVLGCLASRMAGEPLPAFDVAEAVVCVSSWVLFGVTVAAPALAGSSRGLHGLHDPELSPRAHPQVRSWHYFTVAACASLTMFTLALTEPSAGERAAALAILATAASLFVFAVPARHLFFGRTGRTVRISPFSLLLALLVLGAALTLVVRALRNHASEEPAVGMLEECRSHADSCSSCLRSAPSRCRPASSAFASVQTRPARSSSLRGCCSS